MEGFSDSYPPYWVKGSLFGQCIYIYINCPQRLAESHPNCACLQAQGSFMMSQLTYHGTIMSTLGIRGLTLTLPNPKTVVKKPCSQLSMAKNILIEMANTTQHMIIDNHWAKSSIFMRPKENNKSLDKHFGRGQATHPSTNPTWPARCYKDEFPTTRRACRLCPDPSTQKSWGFKQAKWLLNRWCLSSLWNMSQNENVCRESEWK